MEVHMSEVAPSTNAGKEVSNRSAGRYAAYVFWIMFSINLLNYLDRYVFAGASNIVGKELVLSIDQIGFLATAFIFVYPVGTLPLVIWRSEEHTSELQSQSNSVCRLLLEKK